MRRSAIIKKKTIDDRKYMFVRDDHVYIAFEMDSAGNITIIFCDGEAMLKGEPCYSVRFARKEDLLGDDVYRFCSADFTRGLTPESRLIFERVVLAVIGV